MNAATYHRCEAYGDRLASRRHHVTCNLQVMVTLHCSSTETINTADLTFQAME